MDYHSLEDGVCPICGEFLGDTDDNRIIWCSNKYCEFTMSETRVNEFEESDEVLSDTDPIES